MNAVYLGFEQMAQLRKAGVYVMRCNTPEQAQEYAQKDQGLVAIRFMDGGTMAYAAVEKTELLKVTNRGGNAA